MASPNGSEVVVVAAVARNGAIGRDGGLVFVEPADQRRFRALTIGHAVVMGRRTWQSLPERFRPLPGRRNVVVSGDPGFDAPGADVERDFAAALALLAAAPRICVIGGARLYAAALPVADTLELTEVDADLRGDVDFPAWNRSDFAETERVAQRTADGVDYAFVTYRRTPAR